MILFFRSHGENYVVVECSRALDPGEITRLKWAFGNAQLVEAQGLEGTFTGPRKEMITPWSTNAAEIVRNMGITCISRIEQLHRCFSEKPVYDPMLQTIYNNPGQDIFTLHRKPEPIQTIENIAEYNRLEGLALSPDEIEYLNRLSQKIGRKLTDSEIFGFSQVNSEHCRHKIFNGVFILDGQQQKHTLFDLIRLTTATHPNRVVSAYKDNCAFIAGPRAMLFSPSRHDSSAFFAIRAVKTVVSLKAETHNFPTTVEPFNGAATGTGGEIRDRMAGGTGSFPVAGTAVYMVPFTRLDPDRQWENAMNERKWLYHPPAELLIKSSNGASDFGNKFGQPLICGSVFTFEYSENNKNYGYDKVIMLAGGIGFAPLSCSIKGKPSKGDCVVLLGGDNYRIGMGGGAVSSVATGEFAQSIELNAVQRSNPEMQKRVYNTIRALAESNNNPVISIHDHGAGGHLNCLSELVDPAGGTIFLDKLPVGDPSLSAREIIGNESQERMGLVMKKEDLPTLESIAARERAPMYVIGEITGNKQFTFKNSLTGEKPLDLNLNDFFGNPPKTILYDTSITEPLKPDQYDIKKIEQYLCAVLQTEQVACKDYLTNKVDRSVTGRIATQQCCGIIQLPLNNLGVVALDYSGLKGIATSIGHAPAAGLISPAAGSVLSIAEALTNIIWTPIDDGLNGVSLSANWMWPCKNRGEDARLYQAVKAASDFALRLGINIPTGKDSLSMTQKYPDGSVVYAPGTVIISAAAVSSDITKTVSPVIKQVKKSVLFYVGMSFCDLKTGGSVLASVTNQLGNDCPSVNNPIGFRKTFSLIQKFIAQGKIFAGHDISAGGLITALLEMNFPNTSGGMTIRLDGFNSEDHIRILFSENPGLIIQSTADVMKALQKNGLTIIPLGSYSPERKLTISNGKWSLSLDIDKYRDIWYKTSYLLDCRQSGNEKALERFNQYKKQPLKFRFNKQFTGRLSTYKADKLRKKKSGIQAAIIREKGVNGDREMAWIMYLAGLDVKDVHMTDLISGRETLSDINLIVFVGGFSNSDVLGSAKGWAGAFLFNPKAKQTLDAFYARPDTLSLGVCNGCQLMIELGLITPAHKEKPMMLHNDSHKFESNFLGVEIHKNNSVLLSSLAGSQLGIWVAHGEGKFKLPLPEKEYNIPMKYTYADYPANPNGSDFNAAALCSDDGRHLAMMPHLERCFYPHLWAYYPAERKNDQVTPWIEPFVNAREWIKKNRQKK